MRRCDEQFDDGILVLCCHAAAPLAAPGLSPERIKRRAFDISAMRHGHDHLVAFNQVFILETIPCRCNLGNTRGGISIADLFELFAQHTVEFHPVRQN